MRKLSLSTKTFSSFIALVLCSAIAATGISHTTQAISATDFNAGNIIDDSVFYNKDAMSVSQIQSFLNSQIPSCDVWGAGRSGYGNLTRAQYAQQIMGWPGPPYVCLTQYYENPNTGETSYEKGGGAFAGGISAAQIIYNAAQQYGINPQVLLVMLKKESAGPLTADNWPLKSQYKYSMGYGCPDSGPNYSANCSAQKAGFYNQMMTAAWQLNYYKNHPNDYRYYIGQNQIQYSPDPNCGTKSVNIQNIATLSLYIYTPYTPNDAALRNYPGTASCGAYGNRNFFMFFSEWFGSTHGVQWTNLQDPRVLVTNKATSKINPTNGQPVQSLSAGQQIKFQTKIGDCLRTAVDTANSNNACVKINNLSDFSPTSSSISSDGSVQYRKISQWTCKVDYLRLNVGSQCFNPGTTIAFSKITTVQNTSYAITQHDDKNNISTGFRFDRLSSPIVVNWSQLQDARIFVTAKATNKINPYNGEAIQSLPAGQEIKFSTKSDDCLRTAFDTANNNSACVKISDLKEFTPTVANIQSSSQPQSFKVIQSTCKVDYMRDNLTDQCVGVGDEVKLVKKVSALGVDYGITQADSGTGVTYAYRLDRLKAD